METSYLYGLDDVELAIKFTLFFKTKQKKKQPWSTFRHRTPVSAFKKRYLQTNA